MSDEKRIKEPRLETKKELTKIIQNSEMYDLAWKYCDLNDDGHDDWARKLADAILAAGFTKSNLMLNEEKLLRAITVKLEEYGMPKFKDNYPAMDILQLIKDAGYIRPTKIRDDKKRG